MLFYETVSSAEVTRYGTVIKNDGYGNAVAEFMELPPYSPGG
jgi:hypothetical protein